MELTTPTANIYGANKKHIQHCHIHNQTKIQDSKPSGINRCTNDESFIFLFGYLKLSSSVMVCASSLQFGRYLVLILCFKEKEVSLMATFGVLSNVMFASSKVCCAFLLLHLKHADTWSKQFYKIKLNHLVGKMKQNKRKREIL